MKRDVDMLTAPLLPSMVRYAIPLVFIGILQLLFNAADLMVVGQFCGSLSVAAVGATTSATNLLVLFFIGISVGAGVVVARGLGAGEAGDVDAAIHTAVPLAILCGLVLTVAGLLVTEDLLIAMGTPANVLPLSVLYMRIIFFGVTFNILYNFGAAILRAAGDTRGPLVYLTIAGVANVILNVILVTVVDLNVAGVALATTASHAISAALVLRALAKRSDCCRLVLRKLKLYPKMVWEMIRIGLPAGLQSSLFCLANVTIQSAINSFGDVFVAGNSAAVSIESFVFVIGSAFQQTAVNFVGQNAGAKQYDRVGKTTLLAMLCSMAGTLVLSILLYLFGPALLGIYLTDSPQAIEYGMLRLIWVDLFFAIYPVMDVCTAALRGLGHSFVPMLMSVVGICGFRILWIYSVFRLPAFHTPVCLYLSFPLSWVITGVFQLAAFLVVFRRIRRQEGL